MPVKRAGIKMGYDPAIARQAICCADVHNDGNYYVHAQVFEKTTNTSITAVSLTQPLQWIRLPSSILVQ